MTENQTDAYPMPTEGENPSFSPSVPGDQELPPFQDITEEDIFAHNIDDALLQEAKNELDYNEEDLPEREYIPMPTIFEPIPEEAQKEILSKFALKKREKESTVTKTAQRLVNQFRALSAFRDDYVVEYNEELLNASEEIISFLPSIIGGPAVREYLDYLLAHKQQGKVFDQNNIDFSITKKQGYLPSPDEDTPSFRATQGPTTQNISIDQTPLIQQTQILSDTLTSLKDNLAEQTQELKSAIQLMGEAINRPVQIQSESGMVVQAPQNSEQTVQSIQAQREMLESAFEKMLSMQSDLFQRTIEELSKTVQTMQEQLRPTGVVRQALSSLKAAQQTPKEDPVPTAHSETVLKDKKSSKKASKKQTAPLQEVNETQNIQSDSSPTANQPVPVIEQKQTSFDIYTEEKTEDLPTPSHQEKEEVPSFEEVSVSPKEEKPFSLLDELGISDELDLYDNKKNKSYSLLDELEEDEMEILSEFDISKHD